MDLIVAVDQNWAIGKDGEQLLYLSQDLKRFKALTLGHAVILGRRTLSTFPGGRPLKGRRNLILSTTPDFAPGRAVRSIPPWTPSSPPLRRMPLSSAGSPSTAPFWTGAAPPMSLRSWPSTRRPVLPGPGCRPSLGVGGGVRTPGGERSTLPVCDLPAQAGGMTHGP